MPDTEETPVLAPARNSALSENVAETLREAIAQGKFTPGQRLREGELADALQVSRGPIREALMQLDHEGLVVQRRHRGAEVVELSLEDVDEVYTLRLALECLAAERAAQAATTNHFAAFDRVLGEMTELREDYKANEAAALDIAFHDIIYEAADHGRLLRSWRQIRSQVYLFLYSRSVARHDFNAIAFREHSDIRQALASRDSGMVVREVEKHLKGAYERLIGTHDVNPGAGQTTAAATKNAPSA